jgi:hypothetical protein
MIQEPRHCFCLRLQNLCPRLLAYLHRPTKTRPLGAEDANTTTIPYTRHGAIDVQREAPAKVSVDSAVTII